MRITEGGPSSSKYSSAKVANIAASKPPATNAGPSAAPDPSMKVTAEAVTSAPPPEKAGVLCDFYRPEESGIFGAEGGVL